MKFFVSIGLMVLLANMVVMAQQPDHIFVFLNNRSDKAALPEEELKKIMDGHMANINRLAKEGKLVSAGPFDGGGGIFIFKSNSIEQVREWLNTDPGVQAKRWNVEVLPYYPSVGSACLVSEPYQMVSYQFIRFVPNVTKYNINHSTEKLRKHYDYLESLRNSGKVISEAHFGENEGGILVIAGELSKEAIDNDPALIAGVFVAEIKKLWIAKGAFCEK